MYQQRNITTTKIKNARSGMASFAKPHRYEAAPLAFLTSLKMKCPVSDLFPDIPDYSHLNEIKWKRGFKKFKGD